MDRARPDLAVVDTAIIANCRVKLLTLIRGASMPLIAVAVRDPAARVELLFAGVDDCLPPPYTSDELAARVIAIGRRLHRAETVAAATVLWVGPLQLDLRARSVQIQGSKVTLTAMEFDLLSCFLRHPGEVLSRERLLAEVWGYPSGALETVTVVNHSCDPNCGIHLNVSGAHNIVTRRSITAGHEITFNYAMRNYTVEYFPAYCRCGSPLCRGRITGWKDLPTQRKVDYRGFVAPYLIDIDENAASTSPSPAPAGRHRLHVVP